MMILQMIAISVKELKLLWKDKEALALLFLMPAFFILVMSVALQGVFESGSKKQPVQILLVNQDHGNFTEKVIKDLYQTEGIQWITKTNGKPLSIEQAESLIRKKEFSLLLVFKDTFSDRVSKPALKSPPLPPAVLLIADPALNQQLLAPIEGAIRGVIERHATLNRIHRSLKKELDPVMKLMAAYSPYGSTGHYAHRIEEILKDLEEGGHSDSSIGFTTQAPSGYQHERRPTATEQNVPAYTIFGVFFIMLTLATSIYKEKADGTFQRLLAAPLSKTALLIGKLLPYHLVNLIQITLMFTIGVMVFHMHLGNLLALFVVSVCVSITANGLGLLIAAFSRTYAQVNGFSVLLAVTLSALGGMMVPTFVMPDTLKTISLFTPHAWALAAYHDIIIRGAALEEIVYEIMVLIGFACFFFSIAIWRFRFN